MTSNHLFSGAFMITSILIVAGLFSRPANAFSEEELHTINGPIQLNVAGDAQTEDFLSARDLELYIGADQKRMSIKVDNRYHSNLNDELEPAQIGRFRLRF